MFALRNLIRLPAKTVLLCIVILTVLFLLMWSTFLSSLCTDAIDRTIGELNGAVKVIDADSGGVPISVDTAERFRDNFGIITGYAASAESICAIPDTLPLTVGDPSAAEDLYAHSVAACTSMEMIEWMISGDIEILSGNGITATDEKTVRCKAVISLNFAEKNALGIGDPLTLSWKKNGGENAEQEFVVGGIYRIRDTLSENCEYNYQIVGNTVFVPLSTCRAVLEHTDFSLNSLYFYLKHNTGATVQRLEERLHEIGYQNIELKLYTPENVTAGIAKLLGVLRITSVTVMLCGLLVLFIVIFLNIQSRKKEIGILIALGKTPRKIVRSLFTEILVIGACSSVFAVLLFLLSASVSKKYVIGYLMSDAVTSEFRNTSSETFFQNLLQKEAVLASTRIPTAMPILSALGMFVSVSLTAWLVIRFSAKKTNPMLVFGEDT